MYDAAVQLLRRLQDQWGRLTAFWKLVAVLALAALLCFAIYALPGFGRFQELFSKADPRAQSAVLGFAFVVALALGIFSYERSRKADTLKTQLKDAKTDAANSRQEAALLQERWDRLLDVVSREQLWQRPCRSEVPKTVIAAHRKTRFITMLNLKGGVGKTTLSANLGAILALDYARRVLLVDIDFQGTLSDATVDKQFIQLQANNQNTAERLLSRDGGEDLVCRLAVPMNSVPGAKVILADDRLEQQDYSLQARFFVDPSEEVRFFFANHFHKNSVFDQFDIVIFDCPPRLTTSTVNALACSDAVIIPTKLDVGSVNAVPRTIDWLHSLTGLIPARLVGVVATHATVRAGALTRSDKNSYNYLAGVVSQRCPGQDLVFKSVVPATPKAVSAVQGLVAAVSEEGRTVFRAVTEDLKGRLQL